MYNLPLKTLIKSGCRVNKATAIKARLSRCDLMWNDRFFSKAT